MKYQEILEYFNIVTVRDVGSLQAESKGNLKGSEPFLSRHTVFRNTRREACPWAEHVATVNTQCGTYADFKS